LADHPKDANEFTLVISEKGGAERRQVFRTPEVAIGRVPGNDIVLAKGNVSKKHARLLFREGRLIVTDLSSTNGTFVNRRRIAQATILRPEDRLFIGDYVFRVELHPSAAQEPDTPERLVAPPLPAPLLRMGGESESGAFATLIPNAERISEPPVSRTSSGPPPRKSDSGDPSGRLFDPAAIRSAVANIVSAIARERGKIPLEIDDANSRSLSERVAAVVDQLLVDGQIPVGTSGESIHDAAVAELVGIGPLGTLLDDPEVTALSASRFDQLVEIREGRLQPSSLSFSTPMSLEWAVLRLLSRARVSSSVSTVVSDVRIERASSVWRASFAKSGTTWVFSMDRVKSEPTTDDDLVRRGVLSRAMASYLSAAMMARSNVLLVGALPADLRMVADVLLHVANKERFLWLGASDGDLPSRASTLELPLDSGEQLRTLEVVASLPLTRLVLAPGENTPWLLAMEHAPMRGASLLGLWQGSGLARAVARMPADLLRHRPEVPLEIARSWVETAFDIAVEVNRLADGRLRVTRIAELHSGPALRDIFAFQGDRALPGGGAEGKFVQVTNLPDR
jgi:pilus assembly protein CpaF